MKNRDDLLLRIILIIALLALAFSYKTHEEVAKIASFIENNEFIKQ